jgi:SAM-dependent methyltransferase
MPSDAAYAYKPVGYFCEVRRDMADFIPSGRNRVLDIGCGSGTTGAYLLESGKAEWVSGVELVPAQAALAEQVISEVAVGDISAMQLPWPAGSFDVILAGDVLEHLVEPEAALQRLRPLLKPSGLFVASVPNVRHWPVLKALVVHGDWQYQESGVLDRTHLRFYTRKSLRQMLVSSRFKVDRFAPYFWGPKTTMFDRLTLHLFEEFLAQRWLVSCRPA